MSNLASSKRSFLTQCRTFCGISSKHSAALQSSGVGLLVALMLAGVCLQCCHWLMTAAIAKQSADGPVSYVPSAPRLMNRNFKTHLLEQQLEDKESQVRFLRYQLRMAEEAADARAMHVAEQLAAISVLQEQVAAQRKARTQAQLLLASRAADQQRCASRVADLDSDLDVCGTQLTALLSQGAAAAGPAGSHLPQPGAHRG
ncbi:hypothetical protein V8C86DRAFT_2575005 [Haematococcus lacustris]